MQGDLISRDFSVKALREYAEQKHAGGETELANGILKAVCFLQKEDNVPTAYDVEKVEDRICLFTDLVILNVNEMVGDKTVRNAFSSILTTMKENIKMHIRNGGKE